MQDNCHLLLETCSIGFERTYVCCWILTITLKEIDSETRSIHSAISGNDHSIISENDRSAISENDRSAISENDRSAIRLHNTSKNSMMLKIYKILQYLGGKSIKISRFVAIIRKFGPDRCQADITDMTYSTDMPYRIR
ncbi:2525_t:CDS:2 [Cetraspora pellucida]|uniref:2525_t:CDS:1 n=1 Tax=Cetraspora pellucida TaxID=1433469 RepID=A0ACA9KVE1_9GLOM|nr:2525_t:CDS:2 [Cetraspora pellucida]